MGYTMNLDTACKIKKLLVSIDKIDENIVTPEILEVKDNAKELDNMKQFLVDNLGDKIID